MSESVLLATKNRFANFPVKFLWVPAKFQIYYEEKRKRTHAKSHGDLKAGRGFGGHGSRARVLIMARARTPGYLRGSLGTIYNYTD